MKRQNRDATIMKINKLNLHDNVVKSIRIISPTSRRSSGAIEVEFIDRDANGVRRLLFNKCANIMMTADFDVLKDNAGFGNVEGSVAHFHENKITDFMAKSLSSLNVDYYDEHDRPSDKHPTRKKMKDISKYILVTFTFYGGTLNIICEGYRPYRISQMPPNYGLKLTARQRKA